MHWSLWMKSNFYNLQLALKPHDFVSLGNKIYRTNYEICYEKGTSGNLEKKTLILVREFKSI